MATLLDALKSLKFWQIGVLAAILMAVAGATYGAYSMIGSSSGSGLSNNQQLIPVLYGNLVNQVSTNGSLVFPNRATITFGTQGTVGEVLVSEGQQVKEGQPLARLDAATVASLERAVLQARISLRAAEETLAKAKTPYTEEDVAKAQTQVDSAKVSLSNAEKDLKLARKDADAKTKAASDALNTAMQGYKDVFKRWLGIDMYDGEVELSPDTLMASWKVDLSSVFDPSMRFLNFSKGWFAEGTIPSDDPATRWNESVIYIWLNFYPGQLLPTCPNRVVMEQETCVRKEMDNAWDAYQKAIDNLEAVQTQASKAIVIAESGVSRAQDTLAGAEQALTDIQAGPDSLDVALREADLVLAQAALETAIQRQEGATLLGAPISGVVSLVNVEAGQMVNANTVVAEIVDPTVIQLDGIVDEIDVLFVSVGATATVTMDALPGQVLQGTVSTIASAARSQQGVVSYPISIQLQVPQGLQLREGLSATASIVIREENNVLLVPLQALYGTFQQPVVRVMSNGLVEERPVALGNNDDYWVAVRQGLAEGEQVVMEAQQATAGQFNVGQALRQFQGQFGQGTFTGGGGIQRGGERKPGVQPTPRANR